MPCGPVLGRIGSFWAVSDVSIQSFMPFPVVSGSFWVVRIELDSIGDDPETTRVVGRFGSFAVVSVQFPYSLLGRPGSSQPFETTRNDPKRPETTIQKPALTNAVHLLAHDQLGHGSNFSNNLHQRSLCRWSFRTFTKPTFASSDIYVSSNQTNKT